MRSKLQGREIISMREGDIYGGKKVAVLRWRRRRQQVAKVEGAQLLSCFEGKNLRIWDLGFGNFQFNFFKY